MFLTPDTLAILLKYVTVKNLYYYYYYYKRFNRIQSPTQKPHTF